MKVLAGLLVVSHFLDSQAVGGRTHKRGE